MEGRVIPKYLSNEPEWYSWQETVLNILGTSSIPKVHIILDVKGNTGKTFLASWLAVRNRAQRFAHLESVKETMNMVYNLEKSKAYFIDIPSAEEVNKIMPAIKEIANGFCYNSEGKSIYFDRPHVFLLVNSTVDTKLLSNNRQKFYKISDDLSLNPLQ